MYRFHVHCKFLRLFLSLLVLSEHEVWGTRIFNFLFETHMKVGLLNTLKSSVMWLKSHVIFTETLSVVLTRSDVLRALFRNIQFLRHSMPFEWCRVADRCWEESQCLRIHLAAPEPEGEDSAIVRNPTTIYYPTRHRIPEDSKVLGKNDEL